MLDGNPIVTPMLYLDLMTKPEQYCNAGTAQYNLVSTPLARFRSRMPHGLFSGERYVLFAALGHKLPQLLFAF